MLMALYPTAYAQQQPADSGQADDSGSAAERARRLAATDKVQEVVVTGIRRSLETAQSIKQNSEQIVDSVTAQDIGALPDRSVSEALQRIPGITLQRTNNNRDPARLASEGGGVFIRGLSWVRSELNGRDIFSANNGRGLSFEDVSADLLAGIDVYKNPSADMVEGGVGGIVNLRTRMPFDSRERLTAFSGDYNYADLKKDGFWSGNALYSDQWDVGDGRIGGLISLSYGDIGNRTDSVQLGRFEPRTLNVAQDGHAAGSTVYIPASMGWREIDWEQKRSAMSAAFQWEPSEQWLFTLQGFKGKTHPQDIERAEGDYGGYPTDNTSYTFDDQGVLTSGLVSIQPQLDSRSEESHKETSDYSFDVSFKPTERLTLSGDVQYVQSHADIVSMTAFTQVGDAGGAAIQPTTQNPNQNTTLAFNIAGDTPRLSLAQTPYLMENPANYWWAAAMDHIEDNDAHAWAERADLDFKFEENPWLDSFRFGIRATDKTAVTRQSNWNWSLLSHQYWGGGPAVFLPSTPASASELFTYRNFFRGDVQLPGVGWFPSAGLVENGTAAAYNVLKDTEKAGWGWTPLTSDWSKYTPGGDNPNSGVNNQGEKTYAGYGLLRFAHDETPIGPMDGNIGVRVVRTENEALGVRASSIDSDAMSPDACVAARGAAACSDLINAFTFVLGGTANGVPITNNYTDVLPTLNLRFRLKEDLQLRFALGKAIVRPTFSQMMPYTSLTYDFSPTDHYTLVGDQRTGLGGNPDLKPTKAKQLDTSLEWYFAPTGSLTLAGFYKDVRDYIFLGVGQETYESNGVSQTFAVTRNMNGDHGKIKGFEVGYQQFYDSLPGILRGFGMQANFTYVDSSGGRNTAINVLDTNQTTGAGDQTLPLEGLSKTSYNVAAMYERARVSARLAYNWRERYLLTTSAANINRPVWSEDYGQLDASVFYNLTQSIKVGVQGTNLLNTRTYLDVGGATLAPRYSWTDTDRRIAVAMRAAF
jgi:TonB-dependent receptor